MSDNSGPMLKGSITALVTPMKGGKVDEKAFTGLVERQVKAGTHGVVPVGTTGESPTLTHEEHARVVDLCIEIVAGRIPVIAGAGSNSTQEAIMLARHAEKSGADALLTVTGYYNKPSQPGIYAHFKAVHDAVSIPLVIYNVPARTSSDVTVETLARLSELERVIGVKDATANLARVPQQRLACAEGFIQLSGEDITAVGFNAMGGSGCISVTSNIVPELCAQMQEACLKGDWTRAVDIQDRLTPLHEAVFADTSPAPTKYALSRLGLCSDEIRLPLVGASEAACSKVDAALAGLGLL
ncbi:4-hydroxy-tetrahydrodipicolinate synthase [Aquisalinus flavus]|nr:4-hydroxy-tetrahydrodipicolinate synthase [Aquisalinus flavus]MBD0427660.1 4-hydroxy-tetrahydrodipicolinate synthase [Aquisalinus flavus]UNE47445.1 4-hydroxy-tetrahydrodipicolinate synthase [Aquisalinus flavus]